MRTEPRFIQPDDFNNYTGKNLNELLRAKANESNKCDLFLMYVEDCLLARVDAISFRLTSWDNISDYQRDCLQRALIIQAEYILRNSDLFTDSGYDIEKGEIISYDKIQEIAICPTSIDLLTNCGLINRVMRNRFRYTDLGDYGI